jgi:hypothetical protein
MQSEKPKSHVTKSGGSKKRTGQLSWLAAEAKERQHELEQRWSSSAASKQAAGSRYGF